MRSHTATLIGAMRILSGEIQSPDGLANACCAEAGTRLAELARCREALRVIVEGCEACTDRPDQCRHFAEAHAALAASADPDRPLPSRSL